ncbi:MAG: regulatory iron-sulfur-containing complex subunit RicT [Planctomycetota bacterium]
MWLVTVRYGAEQLISNFKGNVPGLRLGDKCVIRTERGTEIGTVMSQPELMPPPQPRPIPSATGSGSVEVQKKPEQPASPHDSHAASRGAVPSEILRTSPLTGTNPPAQQAVKPADSPIPQAAPPAPQLAPQPEYVRLGEVLRRVSPQDVDELKKIENEKKPAALKFCAEKAKALNLPINIAFVEYLLGGEKIVFYFMAEGRIDFRELVKELAKEYRTRIEMHQIGVRDEARLLGDVGHCGHELCCRTCVKELEPVTMKMAKTQKTTLDPTKISGYCGRLMCCLRFEDAFYNELKTQLPRKGAVVKTAKGTGEIINVDLLSQSVIVEIANGDKIKVSALEILEIIKEPTLKVQEEEPGKKDPNGK